MRVARKVPHSRYPHKIEQSYARTIKTFISKWQNYVTYFCQRHIYGLIDTKLLVLDATDDDQEKMTQAQMTQLNNQLDMLLLEMQNVTPKYVINGATTKYMTAVNSFSYSNVKLQTAIVGLNPIKTDQALANYVQAKIAENTSLITSMQSRYAESIREDIYHAMTTGAGQKDVADAIVKRTGMAQRHANLIANDQTGSIISNMNSYRQTKAGAKTYIWQSMEDDRVRPEHQELDGSEFRYNDPDGGDGGQLPGEPINCRCMADPQFE